MKKINVFLNDISLNLFEWMEIRHMLYNNAVPAEYRNMVIEGKAVVADNDGYVLDLEEKIKAEEHYHVINMEEADWISDDGKEEDKEFVEQELDTLQKKISESYDLKDALSCVQGQISDKEEEPKKKREIKNFKL